MFSYVFAFYLNSIKYWKQCSLYNLRWRLLYHLSTMFQVSTTTISYFTMLASSSQFSSSNVMTPFCIAILVAMAASAIGDPLGKRYRSVLWLLIRIMYNTYGWQCDTMHIMTINHSYDKRFYYAKIVTQKQSSANSHEELEQSELLSTMW